MGNNCSRGHLKSPEKTLCAWKFDFLSSANFFPKLTFSKNSFGITIRVANRLDPDQARHFVGPDLVPNCLQRLSA